MEFASDAFGGLNATGSTNFPTVVFFKPVLGAPSHSPPSGHVTHSDQSACRHMTCYEGVVAGVVDNGWKGEPRESAGRDVTEQLGRKRHEYSDVTETADQ